MEQSKIVDTLETYQRLGWFFLKMINRQIPQVQKFISELLEFHKYTFDPDYYRLSCFWQIHVLFTYFDESMASKRVYKP